MKRVSLALSVCSLLAGLWVYVAYRSEAICVNVLLADLLPAGMLHEWRASVHALLPMPDGVAWRLPGGLWVFAATLLSRDLRIMTFEAALLPACTALALEACQACHWTDGAYDPWDIATVCAAAVIARALPSCGWPPRELTGRLHWRSVVFAANFAILWLADVRR